MIKLIIAVVLILAMLSVAGCCCCSSLDRGYSYSTVSGQDLTLTGGNCGQCTTPYDCPDGASDGTCACPK